MFCMLCLVCLLRLPSMSTPTNSPSPFMLHMLRLLRLLCLLRLLDPQQRAKSEDKEGEGGRRAGRLLRTRSLLPQPLSLLPPWLVAFPWHVTCSSAAVFPR